MSTPFPLYVALRYLRSTRRDAFVSFLSAAAAGGIALGVAALILALAALSGFQLALRAEILARTPEIEVELPPGADLEAAARSVATVSGVRDVQPVLRGRGWLLARGRVRPLEIVGYAGELPPIFPGAAGREPGLYLGEQLVTAWGLAVGDTVEIASARPSLSPLGPLPRVRRLALAGSFAAGRTEQVERAALPLAEARALLGVGEAGLQVVVGDLTGALRVAGRVAEALQEGGTVRTWRDLNRPLFFALRLEKSIMFLAVFLIVGVAALALVSSLSLILASKRHEVGMLGAMGARPRALERVFFWLGALLAASGGVAGAALGLGGAWVLDRYRLLRLPGDVYFLDHVPFVVRLPDVAAVVGATALLTLWCAVYAARRAAELQPVEALRR